MGALIEKGHVGMDGLLTTVTRRKDITRFARTPEALVTDPRWVLWRRERPEGRTKPTKVPYQPNGRKASSIAPRTWSKYATVLEAYVDGDFDGIGFMLGDGWTGIDLDDCIDEQGVVADWARRIIDALKTYTEISPSGRGIKMITRGELPPGRRRAGNIEMYSRARFFTVTGTELRGTT